MIEAVKEGNRPANGGNALLVNSDRTGVIDNRDPRPVANPQNTGPLTFEQLNDPDEIKKVWWSVPKGKNLIIAMLLDLINRDNPQVRPKLEGFLRNIAIAGIVDDEITFLERLASKDLLPEDRRIILVPLTKLGQETTVAIIDLMKVSAGLWVEMIGSYDGKKDLANSSKAKRAYAFQSAVEALVKTISGPQGPEGVRQNISQIVAGRLSNFINPKINYFMQRFAAAQAEYLSAKEAVLKEATRENQKRYDEANQRFYLEKIMLIHLCVNYGARADGEKFGSPERIVARQRAFAAEKILEALGISQEEIRRYSYRASFPGLTQEEVSEVFAVIDAFGEPAKTDGQAYKSEILDLIKNAQAKYLACDSKDQNRIRSLACLVAYYSDMAVALDVSPQEIIASIPQKEVRSMGRPITAQELRDIKGVVAISPLDLPESTKTILMNTKRSDGRTYWRALCDEVKCIYLSENISIGMHSPTSIGEAAGLAIPLQRSMEVLIKDARGNVGIDAAVIIHELEHVIWSFETFGKDVFRQSTPNERNSFLSMREASVRDLRRYMTQNRQFIDRYYAFVSKNLTAPEYLTAVITECWRKAGVIVQSDLTGFAANIVLGYPLFERTLRQDPSPYLSSGEPKDFNVYPTNLNSDLPLIEMLMNTMGLSAQEKNNVRNLAGRILRGEASMVFKVSRAQNGRNAAVEAVINMGQGKEPIIIKGTERSALIKVLQYALGDDPNGRASEVLVNSLYSNMTGALNFLMEKEEVRQVVNSIGSVTENHISIIYGVLPRTDYGLQELKEMIKYGGKNALIDSLSLQSKLDKKIVSEAVEIIDKLAGLNMAADDTIALVGLLKRAQINRRSDTVSDTVYIPLGPSEMRDLFMGGAIKSVLREAGYPSLF